MVVPVPATTVLLFRSIFSKNSLVVQRCQTRNYQSKSWRLTWHQHGHFQPVECKVLHDSKRQSIDQHGIQMLLYISCSRLQHLPFK
jgi:hypothetical protein